MARKVAQMVGRSKYRTVLALADKRQMSAEDFLHGCLYCTEAVGREKAAQMLDLPPGRLRMALAVAAKWTPANMAAGAT